MNHSAERNERQSKRHALVLAISLHLAFAAMLYFKTMSEPAGNQVEPKANAEMATDRPAPKAKMVKLP